VILAFWDRSYHGWDTSVPTLEKIRSAFPEKDVAIIGVFNNFWLNQLSKEQLWGGVDLPFRVALIDSSLTTAEGFEIQMQGLMVAEYGVTRFPTTLLIDKQGNVVSLLKPDDFEGTKAQLDRLLK